MNKYGIIFTKERSYKIIIKIIEKNVHVLLNLKKLIRPISAANDDKSNQLPVARLRHKRVGILIAASCKTYPRYDRETKSSWFPLMRRKL